MNQHDKSLLRMSLICFAIAAALLLYALLVGCSTPKVYEGVCRHEAVYTCAVLADSGKEFIPRIAVSKTSDRYATHAQTYTVGRNGKLVWWRMWGNQVYEAPKDYWCDPEIYQSFSLKQFIETEYLWSR